MFPMEFSARGDARVWHYALSISWLNICDPPPKLARWSCGSRPPTLHRSSLPKKPASPFVACSTNLRAAWHATIATSELSQIVCSLLALCSFSDFSDTHRPSEWRSWLSEGHGFSRAVLPPWRAASAAEVLAPTCPLRYRFHLCNSRSELQTLSELSEGHGFSRAVLPLC